MLQLGRYLSLACLWVPAVLAEWLPGNPSRWINLFGETPQPDCRRTDGADVLCRVLKRHPRPPASLQTWLFWVAVAGLSAFTINLVL